LKKPPNNSKSRRAAVPSPTPPPASRRWLFRLFALFAIPALALALAEAVLRLAGYGYDTHLFQIQRVDGQDFLMNNERFSGRFFPPELARWPSPIMMEARKPAGTYRIFIMGESAAEGDPQPAFGAGRFLEVLLRERYPGATFEVVNVAITAINSHVILPIARECARHDGDLWIIYMGNNEMVGPFGAATVFGSQAPPLALVRLNLALQQSRLGQALTELGRKLRGNSSAPVQWGGMQMFLGNQLRPDDPRKQTVYHNFSANLRDIVRAGVASGANVVLCTVAVNLRDCPPFASPVATNLPPEDAAAFDRFYTEGCAAQERANYPQAAHLFEQAARIDPQMADAQFRRGQCQLLMTNLAAAREHLQNACDDDALPFRADSRINAAIRQAAEKWAGPNLALCDAARLLEAANPDGLCGQETFYEHVHFNFEGGYRLGLLWAGQVERFLPPEIKARATDGWASAEICAQRLGLSDWNRADTIHAVIDRMQRPPLSAQSNNLWRLGLLQSQLAQANRMRALPQAANRARAVYADAIQRAPRDYYLHENFGEFLELAGDLTNAAVEWRRAYELMPRNPFAFLTEGQLQEELGQVKPARAAFLQAVALHPRYAEAWLELGKLDASENQFEGAVQNYQRSAGLQPADPEPYLCMGKALSLLKRSPESIQSFRRALELNPNYWEAHYSLGGELGMHGQFAAAKNEFEQVVQLNPDFAMGHLNLGVALLKLNQPNPAREQFRETLRLDPANKSAKEYLAAAEARQKR